MSATRAGGWLPSHSVPASLTPLVGRVREVAETRALLLSPRVRLLTLTGPGGVGKTRVAVRVIDSCASAFDEAVVFVPLASIRDPLLAVPAIAAALDLRDEGRTPLIDRLIAVLRLRPMLLVLDNFEHVVDAGPTIHDLLVACPGLKVLATSRIPLRVEGEQEFPIPPLTVPVDVAVHPDEAMTNEAVALFVQRALAVRPDFRLTGDNIATVAAICSQLDGLPLAIELAAAQSRLLSPRALLSRLDRRLDLLRSDTRRAPERHQTMWDAIAWSDSLLLPDLQRLFQQVAVFTGGWTLDAAEAIVDPALQAKLDGGLIAGLSALVAHNLVTQVEQPDGEPRFQMLETIREYALAELDASGALDATKRRHAEWCRTLALTHWREFFGPDQRVSAMVLRQEIDNLRAALDWTLTQPKLALAADYAGCLAAFWYFHGYWREGLAAIERARPGIDDLNDEVRCRVLVQNAVLIAQVRGDTQTARRYCQEALSLVDTNDIDMRVRLYQVLGAVEMSDGNHPEAERYLQQAMDIQRQHGHTIVSGMTPSLLGRLAYERGDDAAASLVIEASLEQHPSTQNPIGVAWSLTTLARVYHRRGDYLQAARACVRSLELRREYSDRTGCIASLRGLADVAIATDAHDIATQLLAAVEVQGESLGLTLSGARRERFQQAIGRAQAGLSPEEFINSWQAGRQMTITDALHLGQEFVRSMEAAAPARGQSGDLSRLSPREIDVLRLVAAGLSTGEVADQLFISPRTITTHLTSIYNKLGFNTRVAAVRFAAEHGLVEGLSPDRPRP